MVASRSEQPVVVELEQARYRARVGGQWLSLRMDLTLRAGDMAYVRVDRSRTMSMVGDACCGMMLPSGGQSRFLGRVWADEQARAVSAMRGSIGRAGRSSAWLPFLSVADNVVLAQLHHTRRSRAQVIEQAATLAYELGLPGLPLDLPGQVGSADLNRAGMVRALMGRPRLVVLEQPDTRDPELTPLLINRILAVLDKGAAVLWISDRVPSSANDPISSIKSTKRFRLRRSGELEATA